MAGKSMNLLFRGLLIISSIFIGQCLQLKVSGALRSLSQKAISMDLDTLNVAVAGPKLGGYALGGGYVAYRSSVISSLSQLDRGEKEAALETLRVAIASMALQTTQTFGLPILSEVVDKAFNKYGRMFPKTIKGFTNYNEELGKAIINQVSNVAATETVDKSDDVIDILETLKSQIKTDFGREVSSILKNSQGYEDIVAPLKSAKTWAKVAKWADFLLGPIFDAANIAFTGWQLEGAIKSGDNLAIASGSIGIVGSIVGIGSFVAGSLATVGSILATAAGPVGAVIGCVLTLASLIIDVINEYNPSNEINEHLQVVKELTAASKGMLNGIHSDMLQRTTENGIEVGFNELYEVNQAMLIEGTVDDEYGSIKGFKDYKKRTLNFKPEYVSEDEEEDLVVGTKRVFDKKYYQNWIFKPTGREEIGYDYYGRVIREAVGGMTIRLNTDMVTNEDAHMWFWLNGAHIKTYRRGKEEEEADDNVNLGDFRTLLPATSTELRVDTGGGNDLLQMTGIVCAEEKQEMLQGRCLVGSLGEGHDTVSFEGMNTKEDKRKWLLDNGDFTKSKLIVGVSFDMRHGWISYRMEDESGSITTKKFSELASVEGFIGSPLSDVVIFDDSRDYTIKEYSGNNEYQLHISNKREPRQYVIEDNSDNPGKLIIYNDGLLWNNVVFSTSTNIILIVFSDQGTAEIFIKRSKPGLENFKVQVNDGSTKAISDMRSIGIGDDVLLPFIPYQYHFDKDLFGRINQQTYVELLLPEGDYPEKAVSHKIKFTYAYSELLLSNDLLDVLRAGTYTLTAKRKGDPTVDGSWTVHLNKPNSDGGWQLKIGQNGIFSRGVPGSTQTICNLAKEQKEQVDIFLYYKTIMEENSFDSADNFYGTDEPDRLLFKFPRDYDTRDPVATYVIDLKGPQHPSIFNRNELVLHESLILRARGNWRGYFYLKVRRESLSADWHLIVSSQFTTQYQPVERIDITLKGVHSIITGQQYGWKMVLNLVSSQETEHNLMARILAETGG